MRQVSPSRGVDGGDVVGLDDAETGTLRHPLDSAFEPQALLKRARQQLSSGQQAAALRTLSKFTDHGRSYLHWSTAAKLADTIFASPVAALEGDWPSVTVWLCHSYTVDQWVPMLRLAAWRFGVKLNVLKGGYDQYRQEILDPASPLYAAKPDMVLLSVHAGDVRMTVGDEDPSERIRSEVDRWMSLMTALRTHGTARLLMHNFAVPAEDPFGNLARSVPGSRSAMLERVNAKLAEAAGTSGFIIIDCDRLASMVGKQRWFSPKYWHLSKQAVSLECLPDLARHTAAAIAAVLGRSKKCIAVDLDNTLWGGVVGEEGVDGIRIDPSEYAGEAFRTFQAYLKGLKDRGVLLAVCSKNNPDDARQPFRERSEMVLHLDDFAAFEANWDTKPNNLRRIAEQLNIGLDSIVFVDDNPAEREIVRQSLPEVEVVELSNEPSSYPNTVQDTLLFEIASFTAEDAQRADAYRARRQATSLAEAAGSLDEFLRSLEMNASIVPADESSVPRVVQLLAKTNQFNLTTRRLTEAEVRRRIDDPDSLVWVVRLTDKFAAYGLISVLCATVQGSALSIDVWAMSCRVIGRTLEATLLTALVEKAKTRGCTEVVGEYVPTAKNGLVADLYDRFGFDRRDGGSSSARSYRLPIEAFAAAEGFIAIGPASRTQVERERP